MASVPRSVRTEVSQALGVSEDRLEAARSTGGGCISQGVQLEVGSDRFFLKWRDHAPPSLFEREVQGLEALAKGPLSVPHVEAHGHAWLLLHWVDSRIPQAESWERLGHGLADLHKEHGVGRFGWRYPNFIGSLPQPNDSRESWGAFWCEVRLRPLMEQALSRGLLTEAEMDTLGTALEAIPDFIDAAGADDGPSLLHGDLWSGNVMFDSAGAERSSPRPIIIDPAVYYGHREVDLAMTRLFGGFPDAFYHAYQEGWPLSVGHEERVAVYQLYPLLVHLLLFGRSYAAQLMSAARLLAGS